MTALGTQYDFDLRLPVLLVAGTIAIGSATNFRHSRYSTLSELHPGFRSGDDVSPQSCGLFNANQALEFASKPSITVKNGSKTTHVSLSTTLQDPSAENSSDILMPLLTALTTFLLSCLMASRVLLMHRISTCNKDQEHTLVFDNEEDTSVITIEGAIENTSADQEGYSLATTAMPAYEVNASIPLDGCSTLEALRYVEQYGDAASEAYDEI